MTATQSLDLPAAERRWTWGAWLTLAVALGYLLVSVLYVLAAYQQPSEGWNSFYDTPPGWRVVLDQGGSDVLRPDDHIIAIAGQSVDAGWLPRRDAPPGWQVGATARYTVLRDGRTLDVNVPLVQISPSKLPRYMLLGTDGTNGAALACLLFGFGIFLARPGSVAARLLLLILTFFMGTVTILLAVLTPSLMFYPPLLYWVYYGTTLWPLIFAMIAHLVLAFPRRIWPLTRRPRFALGLLYGLPAAGYVASLVTFSEAIYGTVLITVMAAMLCAVVGATIHNLRTANDPVARAQSGWVALGFAGSFVLAAGNFVLSLIVPGISDEGGYLPFLSLPICFGIAILRYRLFDIDIIIRRTLVYSALTLTLGTVYLSSVIVLQALFVRLTGQTSTLAVVASTLAIAALFRPLRLRVQALIDRRFFRRKYDARLVLHQFARRAQQEADLDALSADLLATVDEALKPSEVRLWLTRR